MRIIVDGMGGDHAPISTAKASVEAVSKYGISITLTGPAETLIKELEKYEYPAGSIEILNAPDIITNDEDPAIAIRKKKNSSMVVGLKALADGEGDGFISAGNTGALLAGGLFIVKRIEGIDRAALTTLYPTLNGVSILVDAGANVDSKPEYLKQFAIMGSAYMEQVLLVTNPKVGLINVGTESSKGNQLTKETYNLLQNTELNFIGNIEGRDMPYGIADVMVCDGFVGNIALKLTEGMASSIFQLLKESFTADTKSKLGALLLRNQLKEMKKRLDYREYGGAPLLGTKMPVVKAHGSSDWYAFMNGIGQLKKFIENYVITLIENNIKKMEENNADRENNKINS